MPNRSNSHLEFIRRKMSSVHGTKMLWELNKCVLCGDNLRPNSKFLNCLHGTCNECISFRNMITTDAFICVCGEKTSVSSELICYTLICEKFDEIILKNNFMDQSYQKLLYGVYETKIPCCSSNCNKCAEMYCMNCNTLQCLDCQLSIHRLHKYKVINTAMEEIRQCLMESKVDLFSKLNCVKDILVHHQSSKELLNPEKCELKNSIKGKFDEMRLELNKIEELCLSRVEVLYNKKMEQMTKIELSMGDLIKKYNFYMNFSESTLKNENRVDLDLTNLARNQLLKVRKNFILDIKPGLAPCDINYDLNRYFVAALNQLNASIKNIENNLPFKVEKSVFDIDNTSTIELLPSYRAATKAINVITRVNIGEAEMNRIIREIRTQQFQLRQVNSNTILVDDDDDDN